MKNTKFTRIALIIFSIAAVTIFGVQAFALNGPSYKSIPGSVITDTLVVGNTGYSFAIADSNYLKGGHMQVSNQVALLNIGTDKTVTLERRSLGMLVTVLDNDLVTAGDQTVTYRLVNEPGTASTTINDWRVVLPDTTEGYNSGTNKYLTVDATGNFSWGSPAGGGGGSGSPAGLNTEIQFNNNGSFGSSSDLAWTSASAGVPASLGSDVSFTKLDDEVTVSSPVDDISPSVHLTRGANQSLYNAVTEVAYNKTNNTSPAGTEWNSDGWNDLSDVAGRSYVSFYTALSGSIGNNIIGSELVMHDIAADKYYKFSFSSWGSSGTNGGFSYTRNLINLSPYSLEAGVDFAKSNSIYPTDVISPTVQITRGIDMGIYNPLTESVYDNNNYTSPSGTEWNSDGWGDFSNITERKYVNFYEALGQAVGNNIIGSELIMHDIAADKYYKFSFSSWTQGGGSTAGGFSYTRNLITPSTSSKNKLTSSANFLIGGLNRYLNFGSISGASGYGFRDNDGDIEYKSSGGIWSNIAPSITTNNGSSLFSSGLQAGFDSTVSDSIFLGNIAGYQATNAYESNFLGGSAGYQAADAYDSNFLGYNAGYNAYNSSNSNFLGYNAGYNAYDAANSIFIGQNAGNNDSVDNTTGLKYDWSILLGANTNTGGYSNSILLGSSNNGATISNTKTNQFMLAPSVTEIQLRGIDYTLPLNQAGAAGDVLTNNGSGVLTWAAGGTGGGSSPITIVNGSNLFSTGLGAGSGASATSNSIFLGQNSGYNSSSATDSNFFGNAAGGDAAYSSNSNFFGVQSGEHATNAFNSNFMGGYSGYYAPNASDSNFLGYNSGIYATSASNSNFLGNYSGSSATNASNSNFIGSESGSNAAYASKSNFIGFHSGLYATNASNSNFFGSYAGSAAANASNSIFIGQNAGSNDGIDNSGSLNNWSILLGYNTRTGGFSNSILLGGSADENAISNTKTNQFMLAPSITEMSFRGTNYTLPEAYMGPLDAAPNPSTVLTNDGTGILTWEVPTSGGGSSPISIVNSSNLFSTGLAGTGSGVATATNSIFFGDSAGGGATYASDSNFFGQGSGYNSTSAYYSNFMGSGSGAFSSDANNSNFFGTNAGNSSNRANNSNFLGNFAGADAADANNSNFLGFSAGRYSYGASNSNFFGSNAGYYAPTASNSNFMGFASGYSASYSNDSNFFGQYSGQNAAYAAYSNFLGSYSGQNATKAANSIFIGQNAGKNDTIDNTTSTNDWSILLGYNTNTGGFKNSIILGGSTDGYPIYNTTNNQFLLAPSVTEMRLRGVNYSLPADQATSAGDVLTNDGFGGLTWAAGGTGGGGSSQWTTNGSNINYDLGNVGVGIVNPAYKLHIFSPSQDSLNQPIDVMAVEVGSPLSGTKEGYGPSILFKDAPGGNDVNNLARISAIYEPSIMTMGKFAGALAFSTNPNTGTLNSFPVEKMRISNSGNVGIGLTSPTAILNIKAGGSLTAPIKLTAGTNLIISEAGAIEYDGSHLYFTAIDGGERFQLDQQSGGGGSSPVSIVNATNIFSTALTGAGASVTATDNSIFLGLNAGNLATNASNSNFLGSSAGDGATGAYESNFFGNGAGTSAINASNSNFFGASSGYQATNAYESNFLGTSSGYSATSAFYSNFLGTSAGYQATNASGSNFLGLNSGYTASGAYDSNFIGTSSGHTATNAYKSNFLGFFAGNVATNAYESNFLGYYAGNGATGASDSNFLGFSSGQLATGAYDSNFLGYKSGYSASNASNSNFIGSTSGQSATNAYESNFLGAFSGFQAVNANNSNFLGSYTGYNATNAANSNFIGNQAGNAAYNASNSIFIGQNAGLNDTVNNTTDVNDFSILIGKGTSTGGFKNSIALGGSVINTAVNQFMIGSSARPINTTVWNGAGGVSCTFTTAVGAMNCTSDSSKKKNIKDLNGNLFNKYGDSTNPYVEGTNSIDFSKLNTLDKILALTPVTYNWDYEVDADQSHIGFIAQEVKQIFPNLVSQDINTNKLSLNITGLTPYVVEAIQELNLKVTDVSNLEVNNNFRDGMVSWFSNTSNKIIEFVASTVRAKDKLCIGEGSEEVCITKEELLQIKNNTITKTPLFIGAEVKPADSVPAPEDESLVKPVVTPASQDKEIPAVKEKETPVIPAVVAPIVEAPKIPEIKEENIPSVPVVVPDPAPVVVADETL